MGSGAAHVGAGSLVERVRALRAAAVALVADRTPLDAGDAALVHRELRVVADMVGLVSARAITVVEEDGRWALSGARTVAEHVAQQEGVSVGTVRREVQLSKALGADLPVTQAAVAAGEITLEHAHVLARIAPTSAARREALAGGHEDRNEAALVEQARTTTVDQFRKTASRWATQVDAEAADRDHTLIAAREHLFLTPRDGGVAVNGFLTVEHGAALTTALRAVTGVPAADDDRTPQARQAEALVGLARLTLDRGLAGGGSQVRPHLSVHVPWNTFRALADDARTTADGTNAAAPVSLLPAELDSGEPLAPTLLARIACDSEITRIVFGPSGQVLDVGRAQRTYTGQLRRAVVARDRCCQFPGCHAPPALGEIHHVQPWSRSGPTSVANGILLCWHHHDLVHQRHLRIAPRATGGWEFARVDGSVLTDQRHGSMLKTTGPPGHAPVPPGHAAVPPGRTAPQGRVTAPSRPAPTGPPGRRAGPAISESPRPKVATYETSR
ncbi:HNH endonuclease signature motif containing protein [Actinotalea sp. K2]|uniref:HNH endonuclease signature motif containing protein n=1 Tax=Actinotalea sp. K2 TaxID=2939438 RepID=UPI0020171A70|nr:HNH endonuclease signature motif containing protein [Actinotalea sp. K2]MCL3861571.1 HNH endonuclease [Actinotalea sp. K2]